MPAVAVPRLFWPAVAILTIGVVLGGGGKPAPVPEAAVECVALAALGIAVALGFRPLIPLRADPRWAALLALIVLFPIVQLVPLPPALAALLPGHEAQADALAALGRGEVWRPWSLAPDDSVAAALSLVPAVAIALLTAALPLADRRRLVGAVAVAGLVAALLGIGQFSRGPDRPLSLYRDVHRGFGIGFFANRNAAADLLTIALTAALLLAERWRARLGNLVGAVGVSLGLALLVAGTVVTGSRMGLAVALVPLSLALAVAPRRWRVPALATGLASAALVLVAGSALDRVAGRAHDEAGRADIWATSLTLVRETAPAGVGMGGFALLYAAAEPLDAVQPAVVNRAHNDYLELAIEGGVPALIVLGIALGFVVRRSWRGGSDPDPERRLIARFAGLTALVTALHSSVDYPLRTETLLTLAGLLFGLLAIPAKRPQTSIGNERGLW